MPSQPIVPRPRSPFRTALVLTTLALVTAGILPSRAAAAPPPGDPPSGAAAHPPAHPPADAAPPSRVRGRVLGPDGAPLHRATVRLYRLAASGERTLAAEPATGAGGRFAARLPDDGALLEVRADGFHRRLRWLSGPPDGRIDLILSPATTEAAPPPEARAPGTVIDGRVVDTAGNPLPGARIRLLRLDFRTWSATPIPFAPPPAGDAAPRDGGDEALVTTSDAEGRFRLAVGERIELPGQDRAALEVVCDAPGYAAATVPVQREPEQSALCRMTTDRTRVEGTLDRTGDGPAPRLPLTVLVPVPPAPWFGLVVSDEAGRFRSDDVLPRAPETVLILNQPEARPQVVRVPAGAEGSARVPLLDGADLELVVRDRSTGARIDGAEVRAGLTVGPMPLEREAEPVDGRYLLRNLPPSAEAALRIEAVGYRTANRQHFVGRKGSSETLEIELAPAARIAGRVVDGHGRPIVGARVAISGQGAAPASDQERLDALAHRARVAAGDPAALEQAEATGDQVRHTDAAGRFVLDGLTPGQHYHLACDAAGFAPWWRDGVQAEGAGDNRTSSPGGADGEMGELEIVLRAGAVVRGAVLYDDGSPVEGATVRALRVTPDPDDPKHFYATPEAQRETITDASGRYRLEGLADGTYVIGSETEGLHDAGQFHFDVPPPIPLAAGDELTDLDFYLPTPGTLRLYLEDGPPADGAPTVTLFTRVGDEAFFGGRETVPTRPIGGGVYSIAAVAPAVYDLEVRIPGRATARFEAVEIEGGFTTDVEVEDPGPGATLDLAVVDEGGLPVPGASVVLYRVTATDYGLVEPDLPEDDLSGKSVSQIPWENPSLVTAETDGRGRAAFPGLEPGPYQLHVSDESGRYAYESFPVSESASEGGDLLDRRTVLPEGLRVPVRVESAAGQPLPMAKVVLTRAVEGFSGIQYEQLTGPDGVAGFEHLVPGLYRAQLFTKYPAAEGLVGTHHHETVLGIADGGTQVIRVP